MSEKTPKPKKPSKKAISAAIDKYMAPQQLVSFNAQKKISASKRLTQLLAETGTLTFGALIPDSIASRAFGFVYLVKVTTPAFTKYYVGSKQYDKKESWKSYCTSSDECKRHILNSRNLPEMVKVELSVIKADVYCKKDLLALESRCIWANVRAYGVDAVINIRDAHGYSLRTGKLINCGKKQTKKVYSSIFKR